MNQNLVIVKSKTINNESIPIVFNYSEVRQGDEMDKREISRSYQFVDFTSKMPLDHARILLKMIPGEFTIDSPVAEDASDRVKEQVEKLAEASKGFKCSICGAEARTNAGLAAHTRYSHPEEWKSRKQKVTSEIKE